MAHPISTTEARDQLTKTVKRFREEGATAQPVVFGSHRKPEAVVVPYAAYEALRELAEELAVAHELRERDARDTGTRRSLADVAERFGVDLDDL